jgi:hypothetical protein
MKEKLRFYEPNIECNHTLEAWLIIRLASGLSCNQGMNRSSVGSPLKVHPDMWPTLTHFAAVTSGLLRYVANSRCPVSVRAPL